MAADTLRRRAGDRLADEPRRCLLDLGPLPRRMVPERLLRLLDLGPQHHHTFRARPLRLLDPGPLPLEDHARQLRLGVHGRLLLHTQAPAHQGP